MFGTVVRLVTVCLLLWLPQAYAAITISSARVWPAQDYTRLTLESSQAIRHTMFTVNNPQRLVIDLEDVEPGGALDGLTRLIGSDNPYIQSLRVGRFKPGVVRLVLDLKGEANPQLFDLKPIGNYGYRLVLDVYPAQPVDPLLALLEQIKADDLTGAGAAAARPTTKGASAEPRLAQSMSLGPAPGESQRTPARSAPADARPPQNTGAADKEPATTSIAPSQPELRGRTMLIAIDAGHGGEDPGAIGKEGSYEKHVTLAIARRIKAIIDDSPNMRGVLIRDGDYFIPLGTRVAKARRMNADLFISIHADAFIKPDARGSSVFALSEHGATSAAARWLAKKENEADLIGGVNIAVKDPYLARTLLDLSQTATINDSMKLGKHVLQELGVINDLHRGIVEQAGFAVLKSPDIPSILVETAFISNPTEERRLTDDKYQTRLANAILNGVKRYFAQNPALSKPKIAQINY